MQSLNSNFLTISRQAAKVYFAPVAFALVLPLFALLFQPMFAHADNILFYAGDLDPSSNNANALPNENDAIVGGTPYGAATFQNFIVPAGHTWNVQSLFTNNLASINPDSGYWEIRSNVSEGHAGMPIASGVGTVGANTFSWTPTMRTDFGYLEYQAHVTGLNLTLTPGTYWEAVVPVATSDANRSFNSNTFNCFNNSCVGTEIDDQQFFDSPQFFGVNFTNANNEGIFQRFSSGVDGYDNVPEPSSLIMLGSGVIAMGGLLRQRLLG